jgi:hypothetical protein
MVMGGIILSATDASSIQALLSQYRHDYEMWAELKWTKVSKGKLAEYKAFVDTFFRAGEADLLHYHSIIIDTHLLDHRKYNQGDKELGFYKFYYQLLLHSFGRRYCRVNEEDRFLVFLDQRQTSYKLGTLKNILNHGIKKKYAIDSIPWRNVEPRDSKRSDHLQIVDVLTGAIGFVKNGYCLDASSSPAKRELADHIVKAVGLKDLGLNTPWGRDRFSIWNFRLRK